MIRILVFPASFLLGAVPFGYIAGRMVLGRDIRELGSGNLGASNVFRQVGPAWGLAVLLLDAAKGLASVFMAKAAFPGGQDILLLSAGLLSILGHSFTPYLAFRGGKGVATSAGVFLGLTPAALGAAMAVFALSLSLGRMISLGSLLASLALPIALRTFYPGRPTFFWASLFVAAFVWYRHRSNIMRILKGEEPRIRKRGEED